MKTITPRKREAPFPGYPSIGDVALSRRGFFSAALVTGGGLLSYAGARARSTSRYHRVQIPLNHRLSGCSEMVEKLIVQSQDARLAKFLEDAQERGALVAALRKILGGYSCDDLADNKRLARLEAHLARALVTCYQGRSRRRPALPIVTLVVGRHRNPALDGFSTPPSLPQRP